MVRAPILRRTRAYGVDFARFLAALVRLGDWRLLAEIELRRGWRPLSFALESGDGLGQGLAAPPEFDSDLEAAIARKFGHTRAGWTLVREGAVLEAGGSLVVPDFVFHHEDGTSVALEIVGYWTPEYLTDKLRTLAAVRTTNLIVAVPRHLAVRAGALPGRRPALQAPAAAPGSSATLGGLPPPRGLDAQPCSLAPSAPVKRPSTNAGSPRTFRWKGIVVFTPSTIVSSRARRMRAMASDRSRPWTMILAMSES